MKNQKAYMLTFRMIKESREKFDSFVDEMKELAYSVDLEIVEIFEQSGMSPSPKTYLNSGKIQEIKERIIEDNVSYVIAMEELSPLQYKNLIDIFPSGIEIVDRAELIFMIFNANAKTNLGKYKVELAQFQYELTRITGSSKALSKTGGGIGTRGLGEQKKELDKRYMTKRVKVLKEKIDKDFKAREQRRKNRLSSKFPMISLVGYTNVGKTSILNSLLKKDAGKVENKYFATLEPQTKKLFLEYGKYALISDSVGFISQLPDKLFEAFLATIEEIKFSDLLIVVLSSDQEQADLQLKIINNTLEKLDCSDKKKIIIRNKADLVDNREFPYVSAKENINIDVLRNKIKEAIGTEKS
ncbi:MAG: GTPase HflX [Candidatus Muirbacterium halophilum]|nr:GTPase HflX [Candidatus Muirbacterium halophilum]MCK9475843.1 GTPase HflX [Candidatus Muirbacterium halophilum]